MSMPELFSTPTSVQKPHSRLFYTLLSCAIVLGLSGVILGGYSWFSITHRTTDAQNAQAQQVSQLDTQLQALKTTAQANTVDQTQQLDALQKQLSTLSQHQDFQTQRTFAEVSYQVHLADLRLSLEHEKEPAITALMLAQKILLRAHDAQFTGLQQAIKDDMDTLHAAQSVDRAILFSKINIVMQQVQALSPLPAAPQASASTPATETPVGTWYQRAWQQIRDHVKKLFIVRHVDQKGAPLIPPAQENYVKQNITAALTMAQWAMLHRDQAVYTDALKQAQQWIAQYFSASNPAAVTTALSDLLATPIDPPLPTLTHALPALAALDNTVRSTP